MIKLFFLMIFLLVGSYSLKADETPGGDQDFLQKLDGVKNPFEDGFPKPLPPPPPPPPPPVIEVPKIVIPKPKPVVVPVVLPNFDLQGVIVGEDINEAIIDDKVVPLNGLIDEARIISVSKEGIGLIYKGKKFFLKVD